MKRKGTRYRARDWAKLAEKSKRAKTKGYSLANVAERIIEREAARSPLLRTKPSGATDGDGE